MTDIKTLAANFNETHGRAMTYEEAENTILDTDFPIVDVSTCDKDTAELYAESVRLEERKKVVGEAIDILLTQSAFGWVELPTKWMRELLESLKAKS